MILCSSDILVAAEEEGYRAISAPGASDDQQGQQPGSVGPQQPQQSTSLSKGADQVTCCLRSGGSGLLELGTFVTP